MRTQEAGNMLRIWVCATYLALAGFLSAQAVVHSTWPVVVAGDTLAFPFAGGMEAPQFSHVDLNRDGTPDLLVFDRTGNTWTPLIHSGIPGEIRYTVDRDVLEYLPDVPLWALLRDFNGDGIEDMFASTLHPGIQGVDVYRGRLEDGKLAFDRMQFDLGQFDLLYIEVNDIFTPMYAAWGDIPAIDDIDGDGDLDILSFEPGGSYVHYFRNTAIEQGLGPDTLVFEWDDICWGKFFEDGFSESLTLSNNPNQCADGSGVPFLQLRHSGSTLATLDIDADGDKDLFIGDLASQNIILLENGGDAAQAFITAQDTMFPSADVPVELPFFVAPFTVDVNQDGLMDVIAASNNDNFSENYEVTWYYRNEGSAGAPDWRLQQTDLFVDELLDFGSAAKPCIFDADGDGLLDIIVGSAGFYDNGDRDARLVLLRNTGTATAPAFELTDPDFLGFSAFNSVPTWEYAPTAGDIDGDGDTDLIVGERNGGLFFVENTAGPDMPPEFAAPVYSFFDINVGSFSTPAIVDLNGDGLQDLIVGERIGNNDDDGRCSNLNYFQNQGQPGNALFDPLVTASPNTQCLGNVLFNTQPGLSEYSAPAAVPTTLGELLLVGSEQGNLRLYSGIAPSAEPFFLEEEDFGSIRDGIRSVPAVADMDNDGLYELVLGNMRGGLTVYETTLQKVITSAITPESEPRILHIHPNPAHETIYLGSAGDNFTEVLVTDLLGRKHRLGKVHANLFKVADLDPGIYFVSAWDDGGQLSAKLVIAR